jgi:hypothetical protein
LEGVTDFGDNYAERIRGYLTAPVTGNYYFWIAGSDSAELWISNDSEPANKVRRAFVLPTANPNAPLVNGTASANGICSPTNVPLGSRWWPASVITWKYFTRQEQAPVTTGAWVVSGPIRDKYTPGRPRARVRAFALFSAARSRPAGDIVYRKLLAQPDVDSTGVGSATLRVSADGSQAILNSSTVA